MARLNPQTGQLEDDTDLDSYLSGLMTSSNSSPMTLRSGGGSTLTPAVNPPGSGGNDDGSTPPPPTPEPTPTPSPVPPPTTPAVPPPTPTPPPTTTGGSTAGFGPGQPGGHGIVGPPTNASDDDIIKWLQTLTPANNPGIDPSVSSDPTYWLRRFRETNGNNVDFPYWVARFFGEGHTTEGGGGSGTTLVTEPGGGLKSGGGTTLVTEPGGGLINDLPGNAPPGNGGSGGSGGGTLDTFLQQLLGQYQSLFDRYSKPVSADDPLLSPIIQARRGASSRSLAQAREMMAERAHAEGVGSGSFDSQLQGANERAGQQEGDFESGLMESEQSRRDNLLSGVTGQGIGIGGLMNTNELGNRSLDIQDFLGRGNLANNLFLGTGNLAERSREADQLDTRFYDQLAASLGQNANGMDQTVLRLLLGGGL